MLKDPKKEKPEVRVRNTPPFKLKDKQGRNYQALHLQRQFGFVPEIIIVEKVKGQNNKIIVRAVLTKEELEKEKKWKENLKATEIKKTKKKEGEK